MGASAQLQMTLLPGARDCWRSTRASCPSAMTCAAPSAARSRSARPASRGARASRWTRTPSRSRRAAIVGRAARRAPSPTAKPAAATTACRSPSIEDPELSGTTAAGVRRGDRLARRRRARCDRLWRAVDARTRSTGCSTCSPRCARPVTLLANLATRHLWGAGANVPQLLAYLLDGKPRRAGARLGRRATSRAWWAACRGPRGNLYALADTYPSLGSRRSAPAASASGSPRRSSGVRARRRESSWSPPPPTPRPCAPGPGTTGCARACGTTGR